MKKNKDFIEELKPTVTGEMLERLEFLETHEGHYIVAESTLLNTDKKVMLIFYFKRFMPGRRFGIFEVVYCSYKPIKKENYIEKMDISEILQKLIKFRELTIKEKLLYVK